MISITYHRPNLYCKVSQQVTCLVGVIVECNDFPVASKKKEALSLSFLPYSTKYTHEQIQPSYYNDFRTKGFTF